MRIAVSQLDPVVGAFEGNVKKIREAYERTCSSGARFLVTPELSVCGYPPHDLIERPEMFERNERALQDLLALTQGKDCALLVGHVTPNPSERGRAAQNVVSVLERGKRVFSQAKSLLPTYDVFDEARYFEPAEKIDLWNCDGKKIALAICEDLWSRDPSMGRKVYGVDPAERYRSLSAELVISASASPYFWEKRALREKLHSEISQELGIPLIYVNQVGANDEILFDGGSFLALPKTGVTGRLPFFKTAHGLLDWDSSIKWTSESSEREDAAPEELEIMTRGLVTGIRDYFERTGFKFAILGLSGGIDSAVVATLAARALGPRNVLGVAMPSQHSSGHSMEDAEALARNLGIGFEVRPIKFLNSTATRELTEHRGQLADLALENLQARLRGLVLMTLANHYSALVLTTGNKSELAVGYCTLYGDMCGAIAPIGDLFKTRVYELARYLNQSWGNPIPERSVTKAPSAELRPGQTDQDTLPPYEALDSVLAGYIEEKISLSDLEARNGAAPWIREILAKVEANEYKRRQAAPVLKISSKAFGIGRRIPIAKVWR